jgi:hypothetical protein
MKNLSQSNLHLVNPHFHQTILDAWAAGEDVPYGVIYLSDPKIPLTEAELSHTRELNNKYHWE